MRKLYGSTSWRRVLALALAFAMMFTMMGTSGYSVFAEGLDETGEEVVVSESEAVDQEVTEDIQGPSPGEEEAATVVETENSDVDVETAEDAEDEAENPADDPADETVEDEEGETPDEIAESAVEADDENGEPAADAEEVADPVEEPEEGEKPADDPEEEVVEAGPTEPTLIEEAAQIIEGDDGEMAPEEVVEEEVAEEELAEEELLEEEIVMPEIEKEELFKDARVYVYAPEGAFPEGTEVSIEEVTLNRTQVATVAGVVEEEIVSYKAYDITFNNGDQTDMQPADGYTVKVNIEPYSMPEAEKLQVVHMETARKAEVVESESTDEGLAFDAEHFSVYVVVETGKDARLTVKFMQASGSPVEILVKPNDLDDQEQYETILYDPGVGTLGTGVVFKGWTKYSDYTVSSPAMTIDAVRDDVAVILRKTGAEAVEDGDEVTYYPILIKQYTVDYKDETGAALGRDVVEFRSDAQETAYEYTVSMAYTPPDDEHGFLGWNVASGGSNIEDYTEGATYTNDQKITISGNVVFSVNAPAGHWLIFDEVEKGATYCAPQFVKSGTGEGTVTIQPRPDSEMLLNGYTFGGWYDTKEHAAAHAANPTVTEGKFVFGGGLSDKTTLYASWIKTETATYTVLLWRQNINGDGYDFYKSIQLSGTVDTVINTVSQRGNGNNAYARINGTDYNSNYTENGTNPFKGFHLKDNRRFCLMKEFDQNVTIKPQGNAVLNVYYDRTEYTLTFRSGTGYWASTVKTITERYGVSILNEFPIAGYENYKWHSNDSDTFGNNNLVVIDVMPAENITFTARDTGGYFKLQYWTQPTNLSTNYDDYDLANTITAYDVDSVLTYDEDFMELSGFNRDSSNPSFTYSPRYGTRILSHQGQGVMTVNFYYNRKVYPINFMDGSYYDGNNNRLLDETGMGQIEVVQNVAFGSDTASYNNHQPIKTPNGYVFEGWYIDDACTHPYTFTTMPEGGITVYAKWRQIQYRVFLHPNVPAGTPLDWGSETQQMNFRGTYGTKISVPVNGQRPETGYEFVGWYRDEKCTQLFNADAFVMNDTTVTGTYNKTVDMTDPMDKYGNGATENADVDRFWITMKLDLYAKWHKTLDGAEGISVVYDLNEASGTAPTDNNLYIDAASAIAAAAVAAPEGRVFDHWVMQTWNGNKFVDLEDGNADKIVYAGSDFSVYEKYARKAPGEAEGKYTYTVQLRAEFKDKE